MVELSPWLNLFAKIGIAIGACVLGYIVVRIVAGFLADVITWSGSEIGDKGDHPTDPEEDTDESIEHVPGLHVLSDYGAEHTFVDKFPTEQTICATIRGLDWLEGFHQVLLVTSPGVCFEVGGSLHPEDGLSSSYSDSKKGVFKVISESPSSVAHMEELMVSFYRGDGRWERLNVYD